MSATRREHMDYARPVCLVSVQPAEFSGGGITQPGGSRGMAAAAESSKVVPVETFAHSLSDKMLACRELGHVWVQWDVEVIREGRRLGGYRRTFRCRQCRSERHQMIDSSGHAVNNGYRYADGYLAAHVQRGFSRDTFRLESVQRWLENRTERKAG